MNKIKLSEIIQILDDAFLAALSKNENIINNSINNVITEYPELNYDSLISILNANNEYLYKSIVYGLVLALGKYNLIENDK